MCQFYLFVHPLHSLLVNDINMLNSTGRYLFCDYNQCVPDLGDCLILQEDLILFGEFYS